jgi:hypothetical protein
VAQLFSLGIMRAFITFITLGIVLAASASETNWTMVVEDNTPIIGEDHRAKEAVYVDYPTGLHAFISKHDRVPFSLTGRAHTWTTLHLYRGSDPEAARTNCLGHFQIIGTRPAPTGVVPVDFTVSVTEHQILLFVCDLTNQTPYEIRRVTGKVTQ